MGRYTPYGGQTAYQINTVNAFEGMLAAIGPRSILSYAAAESMGFGLGVMIDRTDPTMCRLPFVTSATLTESIAQVASNSTTGTVNVTSLVAGVPTTVSTNVGPVVYATSDADTLAAIAAAIAAVPGVASATVSGSVITANANNDVSITLTNFVTTGGASQPTWTSAYTCGDLWVGVSLFKPTAENDLDTGVASYEIGDPVSVLALGSAFVTAEVAVKPGDPVYVRFAVGANGSNPGSFGNVADSSTCLLLSNVRWLAAIAAGAVGKLGVGLPG